MSSSGSPRPSPRTGGGVSRRDAMLDAAAKLFSTRGYVDTGIDDIGEAVGVTGPAVYRHFESKEALLIAVLDRAVEHSTAIVPRVRAEATSPDDALRSARRPHRRRVHRRSRAHRDLLAGVAEPPGRATAALRARPTEAHRRVRRRSCAACAPSSRRATRAWPSTPRVRSCDPSRTARAASSEPDLQRLLATMAYAALRAADPNPEPTG